MAGETILHIGYDPALTELREGVLQRGGYQVITLLGNEAVRSEAKGTSPDAIVVGSGGDYHERLEIAEWLLANMPGVPLLMMCAAPSEEFPPGVSPFIADTARDWLVAVDSMVEKARRNARSRAVPR